MVPAARIAGDVGAGVADPDAVAIKAQLDALMDQRDRRPVEVAGQLEVAVQRDPDRPGPAVIERGRWQRPQELALVREPLGDREPAGGVDASVADTVAPARVLLVELAQAAEPARRPEPVFKSRTPPSTDPFSRGVDGVQAVAWKA